MPTKTTNKALAILSMLAILAIASLLFHVPPPRDAMAQDVGTGEVDRTGDQRVSQFSASITAGTPAAIISALTTGKTIVLLDVDINTSSAAIAKFLNAATPDGTHTVAQHYCATNTPRNLSEKELHKAYQFTAGTGVYLDTSVTGTYTVTCVYKVLQ